MSGELRAMGTAGRGLAQAENLCRKPATLREQLQGRKQNLEEELGNVNSAIKALDENPSLEKFMDTVQNALRY